MTDKLFEQFSDCSEETISGVIKPFVYIKNGLVREPIEVRNEGIPFNPSWLNVDEAINNLPENLPSILPYPSFVKVYEYNQHELEGEQLSLEKLGKIAVKIVNFHFYSSSAAVTNKSDAVLFRNLNCRIQSAEDFASFWNGCLKGEGGWKPMKYVPFGKERKKLNGLDLVTPFPPNFPLPCHNEMAYNPKPAGKIAFFCLQNATQGGETILARNADLTNCVGKEIQEFVRSRGGIGYIRTYYDQDQVDSGTSPQGFLSWQEKCGTLREEEAIAFFKNLGFSDNDIQFDENRTMTVQNIHSGFIQNDDADSGNEELWFNILSTGMVKLADGSSLPSKLLNALKIDEWKPVYAIKLNPGDWLVLNNLTVQHGRLPYKENPDLPRTILTVYTN